MLVVGLGEGDGASFCEFASPTLERCFFVFGTYATPTWRQPRGAESICWFCPSANGVVRASPTSMTAYHAVNKLAGPTAFGLQLVSADGRWLVGVGGGAR